MIFEKKKYINLFLFIFLLSSCCNNKNDSYEYLPGKYIYSIPTGEVQILNIASDLSFEQTIFSNEMEIILHNRGVIIIDNENRIKLEHWLECYENDEQKLLKNPYITNCSSGVYWEKAKNNTNISIIIFDQTNYIFRKNVK